MAHSANLFPFHLFNHYVKDMCEENTVFHGLLKSGVECVPFSQLLTTFFFLIRITERAEK